MKTLQAYSVKGALDKAILSLILILLFFTPIFLIPKVSTYSPAIDAKNLLVGFVASTAAALCVFRLLLFSHLQKLRKDPLRLSIVGYGMAILLSALLSDEVLYSLREALHILPLLMIFITMPAIISGRACLEKLRIAIVAAGALVAAYGLCQYVGYNFLFRWFPFAFKKMVARNFIFSTIGNPEYLGSYLAPLVLLVLPDLLGRAGRIRRGISGVLCILFLPALLLTGARGAIIGLGVGSVLIIVSFLHQAEPRMRRRLIFALGLLFVCMIMFVIIFSFPNPINRHNEAILHRFRNLANLRSESLKERILFYSIGAEMIAERPILGVGEGMYRVKFYPTLGRLVSRDERAGVVQFTAELKNRVADNAHNDFLQIWVENGTVGFLTFTLAMAIFLAEAMALLFSGNTHPRERQLLLSLAAATICILVNATFSFPLHSPTRVVLFWCLFGAAHSAVLTFQPSRL